MRSLTHVKALGGRLLLAILSSKLPAGEFLSLTVQSLVPPADEVVVYLCTAYVRYANPRLVVFACYSRHDNTLRPIVIDGVVQFATEMGAAKLCITSSQRPRPHQRIILNRSQVDDVPSSLCVELRGHLDEGQLVFETGRGRGVSSAAAPLPALGARRRFR
jgi:hypothetical protein